jgi:hypothetical protein
MLKSEAHFEVQKVHSFGDFYEKFIRFFNWHITCVFYIQNNDNICGTYFNMDTMPDGRVCKFSSLKVLYYSLLDITLA